jgi:hypothetical protein
MRPLTRCAFRELPDGRFEQIACAESNSRAAAAGRHDASPHRTYVARAFRGRRRGHAVSGMGLRDTRREQNQLTFRRGNEALRDVVEPRVPEQALVPFLCECADNGRLERVNVTLGEWEGVVASRNHYLMIAGHQHSEGERVVGPPRVRSRPKARLTGHCSKEGRSLPRRTWCARLVRILSRPARCLPPERCEPLRLRRCRSRARSRASTLRVGRGCR